MAKITVWRTDAQRFDAGSEMVSRGDHAATLDGAHKAAENLLRAKMANGDDVRSNSLYTWRDEEWARATWKREPSKYLYRLEVDGADIRHTADACYYTEIGEALAAKTSPEAAIDAYAAGAAFVPVRHYKARVEILVGRATVLERYDPPPR